MAVTYYSWDDAGAPQFLITRNESANYQSSIIEIMDAILVTGYGSKPGMGWTKEMTSTVTDSDRTVYKNQSAHQDDMLFIVQSNKIRAHGIQAQIADVVTSPEQYSGYSQAISMYPPRTGDQRWYAVGDERTLIFVLISAYGEVTSVSNWDNSGPSAFYAGDFDTLSTQNNKGWGLLASSMFSGDLDSIGNAGSVTGIMNFNNSSEPHSKTIRPLTQVPGQEWDQNDINVFNASFEGHPTFSNITATQGASLYRSSEDFKANAQIKSDWFIIFNLNTIYRLRGIYNIYPWLSNCDNSPYPRNWGKVIDVFGDDYMAFCQNIGLSDSYFSAMTVYIKLTGDW